ncbi:hypothetical protein ScPMuIL_018576 [Solemya velum]
MVDRCISVLFSLFVYVLCEQKASENELVITHKPQYMTFQPTSSQLQASDIHKVISHSVGVSPGSDFQWGGLLHGSMFQRPKANVLISVIGYAGKDANPLKLNTVAKYSVENDVPAVDTNYLSKLFRGAFIDQNPLMVDASVDQDMFNIQTEQEVFRKLPNTMLKMADRLMAGDSVIQHLGLRSLNTSTHSDLGLMGELQTMQDVVNTIRESPSLLKSKSPDLLSFTISGIKRVVDQHGEASPQAAEATNLVTDFIHKMTDEMRQLYKDNVVVEVLTMSPPPKGLVRKVRSLKAMAAPKSLNLAPQYSEDFPVFFNIILWMVILIGITSFATSYAIWNMDPGRDSIIYRMTSQRLKKD